MQTIGKCYLWRKHQREVYKINIKETQECFLCHTVFVSIQFQRHCPEPGIKNETFLTPKLRPVQQSKRNTFQLLIKPVSNELQKTPISLIMWINKRFWNVGGFTAAATRFSFSLACGRGLFVARDFLQLLEIRTGRKWRVCGSLDLAKVATSTLTTGLSSRRRLMCGKLLIYSPIT